MAVPVVYYLIARRGRAAELNREGLTPELLKSLTELSPNKEQHQ